MRERSIVVGTACFLAMLTAGLAKAADWPQWRGPERDGHVVAFAAPDEWPKELERQWKAEVGEGYASPVVVGDQIFLFSREGENEVVGCLELADGRRRWSQSYPAPYKMSPPAKPHGKGPKSTPVVAKGRLFTLGISGILSCWDGDSGRQLWQHEFSGQFKGTWPLYGTATSPMVEAGQVIAHVGGHGDGALCAFDVQTGQPKWQWDGEGPAYTSPILATLGSTRQVITQSQGACIGVSASDGSLLWRLPFTTRYDMNIVTPVLLDDLVIFSGFQSGTTAHRLQQRQGKWSLDEVWHNGDLSMFMSSPVLVGGRLVGLAQENRGQLFCLDPATGKTLWTSEGRIGENAALVVAGGAVLALTSNAELLVINPGADRFETLARYKVADAPTWAHPVVIGRQILIKDQSSLALWSMGS